MSTARDEKHYQSPSSSTATEDAIAGTQAIGFAGGATENTTLFVLSNLGITSLGFIAGTLLAVGLGVLSLGIGAYALQKFRKKNKGEVENLIGNIKRENQVTTEHDHMLSRLKNVIYDQLMLMHQLGEDKEKNEYITFLSGMSATYKLLTEEEAKKYRRIKNEYLIIKCNNNSWKLQYNDDTNNLSEIDAQNNPILKLLNESPQHNDLALDKAIYHYHSMTPDGLRAALKIKNGIEEEKMPRTSSEIHTRGKEDNHLTENKKLWNLFHLQTPNRCPLYTPPSVLSFSNIAGFLGTLGTVLSVSKATFALAVLAGAAAMTPVIGWIILGVAIIAGLCIAGAIHTVAKKNALKKAEYEAIKTHNITYTKSLTLLTQKTEQVKFALENQNIKEEKEPENTLKLEHERLNKESQAQKLEIQKLKQKLQEQELQLKQLQPSESKQPAPGKEPAAKAEDKAADPSKKLIPRSASSPNFFNYLATKNSKTQVSPTPTDTNNSGLKITD